MPGSKKQSSKPLPEVIDDIREDELFRSRKTSMIMLVLGIHHANGIVGVK